jgi:NitT/TauT family transport system permease protein
MTDLRPRSDQVTTGAAGRPAVRKPPKRPLFERVPSYVSVPLFAALLAGIWQLVVMMEVFDELVLPSPVSVANELVDIVRGAIEGDHIREELTVTTQESLMAFVIAAVSGVALGVLVAETSFGRHVAMPFLVAANAAPKIAFAPLFVAWFGFGVLPKALLGAFIAFFPLMIDTASGLVTVDRQQLRLFRSMRASRWQQFIRLKLPSTAPFIFSGLKTASVLAVVGAIVGEFVGGGNGVGGLLKVSANQLRTDRVMAYVALLSILGYFLYALVAFAERKIVFWHNDHEAPVRATSG